MLICYSTSNVYGNNLMEASYWKKQILSHVNTLIKEDTQLSPAMHIYISAENNLALFAAVTMKQCFHMVIWNISEEQKTLWFLR